MASFPVLSRILKHVFIVAAVMTACMIQPATALSEMYVAGQVGATLPHDLTNVEGNGPATSGFSFSDFALKESLLYGAKLGYYFPTTKWLGVEGEVFNTTPHIKQQTVTATGFGSSVPFAVSGTHLRVLTTALNVLIRYPGARVQPYMGIGLGLFFVRTQDASGSASDNGVPGLNALVGVRAFLTPQVSLFGEYKYNRATFQLDAAELKGDYSASHLVAGLSFHFDDLWRH